MKNSTEEICRVCKKSIDWKEEESFLLEYREPNKKKMITSLVFFHTECFIVTAGKEWAEHCGYKF